MFHKPNADSIARREAMGSVLHFIRALVAGMDHIQSPLIDTGICLCLCSRLRRYGSHQIAFASAFALVTIYADMGLIRYILFSVDWC